MVNNKKKLLLGSALAGIMVAGPGLAVTAGSSNAQNGSFFQTAEFEVGYRLAQAEHHEKKATEGDTKDGTKTCSGDKKCSADKKCGEGKCADDKKCSADKKDSGDKKCSAEKKCSADKNSTEPKTDAKPATTK